LRVIDYHHDDRDSAGNHDHHNIHRDHDSAADLHHVVHHDHDSATDHHHLHLHLQHDDDSGADHHHLHLQHDDDSGADHDDLLHYVVHHDHHHDPALPVPRCLHSGPGRVCHWL